MERYQCLVAVFDDWESLFAVLAHLSPAKMGGSGAVLFARDDLPSTDALPELLLDRAEVNFGADAVCVQCTTGKLATELSSRSRAGADTIAAAVRDWLGDGLARELQRQIETGHLVLWLEPATPDACDAACAELVRASPHLVGRFDIERQS